MNDRKKPGVAFWATVGVTVLLFYVASFGPACWLCEKGILGQKPAWIAYRPLLWLAYEGHERLSRAIHGYAKAWGDERRLESIGEYEGVFESNQSLSSVFICGPGSVSPIDYEMACRSELRYENYLMEYQQAWNKLHSDHTEDPRPSSDSNR